MPTRSYRNERPTRREWLQQFKLWQALHEKELPADVFERLMSPKWGVTSPHNPDLAEIGLCNCQEVCRGTSNNADADNAAAAKDA